MEFREFILNNNHNSRINKLYRFDKDHDVILDIKVSDVNIEYRKDYIYVSDEFLEKEFNILKENANKRTVNNLGEKLYYNEDWRNLFNSTRLVDCFIIILISTNLLGIYNSNEKALKKLTLTENKYISYNEILIKRMIE